MYRITASALTAIALVNGPPARAQAPSASPGSLKFEVASLKPSQPGSRGSPPRPAPGGERYVAANVTLKLLISVAYRIKVDQVAGGPDWINTGRYDLNAKAEKPSSTADLDLMLQDLLADRFKLKFHRETRELPVYALTVDKGGPKLQPSQAQSSGDPAIEYKQEQFLHMKLHARLVPMSYFAWRLGQSLDRPVIDLTKLEGIYDFDLAYTAELPPGIQEGALLNGEPIDISGPSIFEAVRKHLGLKLERQKGPVEIIVVDHAEKAVEN
ncbi:MAG: TIGR03435 family protein [Acidobacteriia bacterium]|nr:TIGR03435 family protein [Terriglobia bacterium]